MTHNKKPDTQRLDQVVSAARQARDARERDYRALALKLYPWICGRCAREFSRENLTQLTVHHRDHNHDNNPPDGSNWELLCVYCHDNEHARYLEAQPATVPSKSSTTPGGTHRPFAGLADRLKPKQ